MKPPMPWWHRSYPIVRWRFWFFQHEVSWVTSPCIITLRNPSWKITNCKKNFENKELNILHTSSFIQHFLNNQWFKTNYLNLHGICIPPKPRNMASISLCIISICFCISPKLSEKMTFKSSSSCMLGVWCLSLKKKLFRKEINTRDRLNGGDKNYYSVDDSKKFHV